MCLAEGLLDEVLGLVLVTTQQVGKPEQRWASCKHEGVERVHPVILQAFVDVLGDPVV